MPATSRYGTPLGYHELDVFSLRKDGFLAPGSRCTVRKSYGGRVIREMRVTVGETVVKATVDGRTEVVRLLYTGQPFGGRRPWFECPRCGRRAGKLYGEPFRCRKCSGITYPSQRTDARGRAIQKAQKLRWQLGGTGSLADPIPDRPWGMWDRTYRRLSERSRAADSATAAAAMAVIARWRKKIRPG